MLSSVILSILIFSILVASAVYFLALRPARIMEKWAAGLSNGGHFPKKPNVGGLYWLLPVHREMQAVADKIDDLRGQIEEARSGSAQDEFLHHCILATLMEGIMVVDGNGIITLVNSEFIYMFQLNQSPLRRNITEVIRDKKLQTLITDSLALGTVQAGRITRPAATAEVGRPQTLEVSVVPLRTKEDTNGAIVLFLPPPDRTRILQTMKRHSQRLENLVSELALSRMGRGEAWKPNKEPVNVRELLEDVLVAFASRPENSSIKTNCNIEDGLRLVELDPAQVQPALMHLLVNLAIDLESVTGLELSAQSEGDMVAVHATFTGGSMSEAQLQRACASPVGAGTQQASPPIIGVTTSFSLIREVMNLHGGSFAATIVGASQMQVSLRLPKMLPAGGQALRVDSLDTGIASP